MHAQTEEAALPRRKWAFKRPIMLLALVCAGLALLLAAGCSGVMGSIANTVYPSLAQPEETEAPPTFTAYLPSATTQAILGGRGQGLNCSIPPLLARLAFSGEGNESDVSLRFRQACVMHDMCYRHGYATYRYTQADCDTMLQQSAYRLCRQIYRPAGNSAVQKVYDDCETEAKKVLLGVTLGGGGSYLAADRSTYFEYDPMPVRADDYVVGRAVPMAGEGGDKNDIGIRTFYVRRNTVEMAMLTSPSPAEPGLGGRRTGPALFPERLIATPPMLLAAGSSQERFAALARDSFGNTDLTVVSYRISGSPSGRESNPAFSLSTCEGGQEGPCVSATDASIRKLAVIDGAPVLLSLTHRGTLKGSADTGSGSGSTVKIVQKSLARLIVDDAGSGSSGASDVVCMAGTISVTGSDGRSRCVMDDYPLNGPRLVRDKYRFLQHDVLLEQDGAGNATHAWVLGRGASLTSGEGVPFVTESPGKDYASRLVVVRQALGNGKHGDTQRFSLNVSEADEPLSLVNLGPAAGTVLMGLAWKGDDLGRVVDGKPPASAPIVKLWTMPAPGQPPDPQPVEVALPQALKDRFIDIPPVVVRQPGMDSPLFVFVRVDDPLTQGAPDDPSPADPKKTVRLRFQVLTLGNTDLAAKAFSSLGEFTCLIDLEKQWQLPAAAQIRTRAFRAFALNEKNWQGDTSRALPAHVQERLVRDLSYRWRMSQLIASERMSEDGKSLLALTMVFNGFPALSTQMLLRPQDSGPRLVQEGACIGAA